jgi:hypothetical protein
MVANNGGNAELRYSWNDDGSDYNFSTGLNLPTNGQWAFFALTIEPSRAIVYLATNSVLRSATNNVANTGQAFNGSFYFGYDPNSNTRRIKGELDEIAIYNRTLTAQQISHILAAAQAATPPAVKLSAPATGAGYAAPASINLAASVTANGHDIASVQFYNGSILLGQSTTAPFPFTWSGVPAGAYTLLAQVTYDSSNTMSSAPVFVTVNPVPSAPVATGGRFNGGFIVSGTAAVGQVCVLLTASNLAPPVIWTPLATNVADSNGVFNFTDLAATNYQQQFYRIKTPF